MDLTQLLLSLFALSLFILSFLFSSSKTKKKCNVPELPGAVPLLGHLRLYDTQELSHVKLGALADVHGPIFATKTGSRRVLIISSPDLAKEFYSVHDKTPTRPDLVASELVGYNNSFLTFCPYGPYWREIRKLTITELLSSRRIQALERSRVVEADIAFGELYRRWRDQKEEKESHGSIRGGVMVDMKEEFHDLTGNISLMMLAGKRYFGKNPNVERDEAKKCQKLVREFRDYFGLWLLSDVAPSIGWLTDRKIKNEMKRTAKEFDVVVESWIKEHKMKKKDRDDEKDYLDVLMEVLERSSLPGLDPHKTAKALSLELVFATSETATVVLVWAVSLLLNNPKALKKAQEELDRVIGDKTRHVQDSDIKHLVYLQAIVKETFRLYPPVPVLSIRAVQKDFETSNGNYYVPAGTRMMVNAWKIQHDPNLWPDPERFEPERFMTDENKDLGLGGQSFRLVPFGMGKRACPGIPLAQTMVLYQLARFLHSFDLTLPPNQDMIDMTETNGLVNIKATPLHVLITPRLDSSLYHVDDDHYTIA